MKRNRSREFKSKTRCHQSSSYVITVTYALAILRGFWTIEFRLIIFKLLRNNLPALRKHPRLSQQPVCSYLATSYGDLTTNFTIKSTLTFNIFIICSKCDLSHVFAASLNAFCVILKVRKQAMHHAVIRWYNEKYPKTFHSLTACQLILIVFSRMARSFKCDSICVKFKTETRFSTEPECAPRAKAFHAFSRFWHKRARDTIASLDCLERSSTTKLAKHPIHANHYAPDWGMEWERWKHGFYVKYFA